MGDNTYEQSLKDDFGTLIDGLALSDLQKRFLRSRWLDQVLWIEDRAKRSQRRYYSLRLVTIVAGVLVPALVSLNIHRETVNSALGWVTFFVSLLVALAAAAEEFFHYGDRWRHYRRGAEVLKSEGWQFFELAGTYRGKTHAEAFTAFAGRVESQIQHSVERYMTHIVQERLKKDEAEHS